jgi:hypothetical protein
MLDKAVLKDSVKPDTEVDAREAARKAAREAGFAWNAAEIGRVIGRGPRQTHHLLTRGEIKCARRVGGKLNEEGKLKGGRWVANISALLREFGA